MPEEERGKEKRSALFNEMVGVIMIGIGLFLVASLLSYSSYDTSRFSSPPNEPPSNLAGKIGAYLSERLYLFLGWSALLIPIFFLVWGIEKFWSKVRSSNPITKGIGSVIFVISLSGLFSLPGLKERFVIGEASLPAGGFVGEIWMERYLSSLFGPLGYLVAILGLVLGYILSFDLSFMDLLRGIGRIATVPLKAFLKIGKERVPKKPVSRLGTPWSTPREEGFQPRIVIPREEKTTTLPAREEVVSSPPSPYQVPPLSLLDEIPFQNHKETKEELLATSKLLEGSIAEFGVEAKVIQVSQGPTVTRFELQPAPGVKVARITGLVDDIALTLATPHVRIETPIPGKQAIGIEIPNRKPTIVSIREILSSPEFGEHPSKLAIALGKDISGQVMVVDLCRMPHLLIAGTTGSGKSICINTIITSILYRATPEEVNLILIDPKRVEFSILEGIPHLVTPIITDAKKSAAALRWVVNEMEERYKHLAGNGMRDIENYTQHRLKDSSLKNLPYIVVIIDELADLMMVALNDCEEAIIRLAQMARAVGIHLVLATQRPSVDVITGIIKANLPSRIAFQVSSKVDSRTILDMNGAERLLGSGDMLFAPAGSARPIRIQGSYISQREIERVAGFIKGQTGKAVEIEKGPEIFLEQEKKEEDFDDELYQEALRVVARSEAVSTSMLQRRLRIGYNRAARLIETMEKGGIIDPPDGVKPRRVYHDRLPQETP